MSIATMRDAPSALATDYMHTYTTSTLSAAEVRKSERRLATDHTEQANRSASEDCDGLIRTQLTNSRYSTCRNRKRLYLRSRFAHVIRSIPRLNGEWAHHSTLLKGQMVR